MATWQLQTAKNRLSELVDRAGREGPQVITRHGKEAAVVLSFEAYQALTCPPVGLAEFFAASPLAGLELDVGRPADTGRPLGL